MDVVAVGNVLVVHHLHRHTHCMRERMRSMHERMQPMSGKITID